MLGTLKPREQSGRDVLARYRVQARSAAIASLSILEGKEIDRVYCDIHDDFVVRINRNGTFFYIFYQVKTNRKKNYNWTLNDIFGLDRRIKDTSKHDDKKITDSFAGKLLVHTVNFGTGCEAVVFQTNINVDDPTEAVISDIKQGAFENQFSQVLKERFRTCFSCPEIAREHIEHNLKKLALETDVLHLKLEGGTFSPIARDAIYRFSEIDLTHDEINDILVKLVELVESKSSGVIQNVTEETIESFSSIAISDLLNILSISEGAYNALSAGGDEKAVKNASIIQRTLSSAGANEDQIEYCSRCKIKWDEWFRNNRHILPEFEVVGIRADLGRILRDAMVNDQVDFISLRQPIEKYINEDIREKEYDLTLDEVLGGVMAELVRIKR